jgi:putative ATP-binding cassette transporter
MAAENAFSQSFNHMLGGFREVKLSSSRGDDLFLNYVQRSSADATALKIDAGRRMALGDNVINLVFYSLVGFMVFILPYEVGSSETASKLINVIIFAVSAVELVVRGLPMLDRSAVAIDELNALESEVRAGSIREETPASEDSPTFDLIDARDLTYSYRTADGERSFVVGPLALQIRRGEVLFVVGGNGSGKSTLLMLLTRLYEPEHGLILWDGAPVDTTNVRDYRHLFSAIFSDFHLFDRLYGLAEVGDEAVDALIDEVQMASKVRFVDGRFSTLELSTGQRKRLALVVARLEDRPIMVFDEWAADQDPHFRRFFYENLIPALRAAGKTVIAVSHDDRFFNAADRVLVMSDGVLETTELVS